jgi:hypothetical protein
VRGSLRLRGLVYMYEVASNIGIVVQTDAICSIVTAVMLITL